MRLAKGLSIECTGHGIQQVSNYDSFETVATIDGPNEVHLVAENGTEQAIDPLGRNIGGLSSNDDCGLGAEKIAGFHENTHGRPWRNGISILRADGVQGTQRLNPAGVAHIVDGCGTDNVASGVARTGIGVEYGSALSREILKEAFANHLDNLTDGFGMVVGVQTHKNVDFANADELAEKIIGKDCFVRHQ